MADKNGAQEPTNIQAHDAQIESEKIWPPKSIPLRSVSSLKPCLLLEINDEEFDLEGDIGAIGRLGVKEKELTVDIKGKAYNGQPYQCNTLMIVSLTNQEAKIDSLSQTFIPLKFASSAFNDLEGVFIEGARDDELYVFDDSGNEFKDQASDEEERKKKRSAPKKSRKAQPKGSKTKTGTKKRKTGDKKKK